MSTSGAPRTARDPQGSFERAAQDAHREWLRRGRTGAGRFEIYLVSAYRRQLEAFEAVGGSFERVDLTEAVLSYGKWQETDLVRSNFTGSIISSTQFSDARIVDCKFDGAKGQLPTFVRTSIYGSSFIKAALSGTELTDAVVTACNFDGAWLGNGMWDRARFSRCSFRGTSFEPSDDVPVPSMRGTVFEACDFRGAEFSRTDLRGATFIRCKFADAYGVPWRAENLHVEASDVSLLEQLWRVWDATALQQHRNPLLLAVDRSSESAPRALVFEIEEDRIRLLGTTNADSQGSTFGTSGVVWLSDGDTFMIRDYRATRATFTRTEMRTAGGVRPVSSITAVGLFAAPGERGRRGVLVRTPQGKPARLVIVQDHDHSVDDDPSYSAEDAWRDSGWTRQLASELAAWLGVPFEKETSG